MSNLTNFNNFELNTEEKTNVEGGWGCYSRSYRNCYSSYSYNNCYSSYSYNNCYSSYSYNNCEPAVEEVAPVQEVIIEAAPVVEAPAPAANILRGVAGA